MKRCETCVYSLVHDRRGGSLICHRNPPQIIVGRTFNGNYIGQECWPCVSHDDWCGEYSSNRSPSDLSQSVLADLAEGHSLRKTAARQGTTLAVVRGIQKRSPRR